jgi:asparagine synthase (glutamine-hydrolysing)
MCGIAGLVHTHPVGRERLSAQLEPMAHAMLHRGPDADGQWVDDPGRVGLAFRRLSILDLSPAGHQPMVSPSGRWVMVFNGEVYNFRALREELREGGVSFRGGSDSEVLLAGVDAWGIEATLQRLIGMFAIALWDRERQELSLVRDRVGIKPLYIAHTRTGIGFASELGALVRAPGFDGALDPEAIQAYVRYLFVPGPGTPIRSIRKLAPGHWVTIPLEALGGDVPASRPYWSIEEARSSGEAVRRQRAADDPGTVDELEALLSDAVRLRLVADVPLGALLSGGIDSSVVVALMQAQSSRPVKTFTIGFDRPEHDESGHALAVARHLGTDHTSMTVSDSDALDVVDALPRIFDEPLADPSQIPTFLVSRLARETVTVALSGDGGDELFAGYNRYVSGLGLLPRLARLPRFLRRPLAGGVRALPEAFWRGIHAASGRGNLRLAGAKAVKLGRLLNAPTPSEMYRTLLSTIDDPERYMTEGVHRNDPISACLPGGSTNLTLGDMLASDQRYYLPDDLLQKVDRASMATSLEARVPILDHRVVEFSWGLPDDLKIRNGQGKWLLRQVLLRHVPSHLIDRPKTGFSVPLGDWMRGALREWSEYHLFAPSYVRDAVFDPAAVRQGWDRFIAGRDDEALGLWAMIVFEAWRDHWRLDDVGEPIGASSTPEMRGTT